MRLKSWHLLAIISCPLWIVYYPALFAPLNSVDDLRLANDLLNRTGFSWGDFWIPRSKAYFRPLVNSSFIVDSLLWGFEASFLHLENVLLHWLNTLLVFRLAGLVAVRQGIVTPAVPTVAALLFSLHPINTEAVIWVAGRADLLATTFILLTIFCALRYLFHGAIGWIAATALAYLLGALAKETALLVLPGLLVFGWLAHRESVSLPVLFSWSKALLPAFAGLLGAVVYVGMRYHALSNKDLGLHHVSQLAVAPVGALLTGGAGDGAVVSPWWDSLATVVRGAGFYACKLVQPFPLNFGIIEVDEWYLLAGCLLIPLAFFLLWRLAWWGGFVLTAMSLASIALLVALGNFSWTPFAERYMYAPAAMLAIAGSLAGGKFYFRPGHANWKPWLAGALGAVLLLCSWGIYQRGLVWQDNLTLFADTVQKSPGFALAQNQLAQALWDRGRKNEALEIIRRVDMPESQVAFINKVFILLEEGRLVEARKFLLENLDKPRTQAYHKVILERLIDVVDLLRKENSSSAQILLYDDEAIGYLKQLWQRTNNPFYLYRLGQRQLAKGDRSAARESFALAYAKFPQDSIYKEPARKLAEGLKDQ